MTRRHSVMMFADVSCNTWCMQLVSRGIIYVPTTVCVWTHVSSVLKSMKEAGLREEEEEVADKERGTLFIGVLC